MRFRESEGHADYTAISLKIVSSTRLRKDLTCCDSAFATYWMRESAQMADSEITESADLESRLSNSVILW